MKMEINMKINIEILSFQFQFKINHKENLQNQILYSPKMIILIFLFILDYIIQMEHMYHYIWLGYLLLQIIK